MCAFRICLGINNSCIMIVCHPTLFCLTYSDWAFLAVPGLGGGGGGGLRFLETREVIDMKLTPLIKRHGINLLPL